MKPNFRKNHRGGYISLLTVLTISIFMLTMMIFAYKRADLARDVQATVQAQTDYREKEEMILRSIVSLTPNRAILAMQDGSNSSPARRDPLSFQSIFTEALAQANARQSIPQELLTQMAIPAHLSGNTGDSTLANVAAIFRPIGASAGIVSGGLNRDLGAGFPPALNSAFPLPADDSFPIVSSEKAYGILAQGRVGLPTATYRALNVVPYPQINFGYSAPGMPFVAKRNWWAFSMSLARNDDAVTGFARADRDFVLSLYEIPSQLPISASSYMALGTHATGEAWGNQIAIAGNVFAGRADVQGSTALAGALATRRGSVLSQNSTVGGQNFLVDPLGPGVRETFRLTQGNFFPVSLASESGKAAFVPINRGAAYYDRFSHNQNEANSISATTWNNYSIGALQCAMTLDITESVGANGTRPVALRFTYLLPNGNRAVENIAYSGGSATGLGIGFTQSVAENNTAVFNNPVDVAYGAGNSYYYKNNVTGPVLFDNQTFGDPIADTPKHGYYRIRAPFEIRQLPVSGQYCVAVYPERFRDFLATLQADGLDVNHSLAVNVDYVNNPGLAQPAIPCTNTDYGLILEEAENLTSFTRGFSLVTNLRLYIGSDFNDVPATPPAGYVPPNGRPFYPPCSVFSPERRFGVAEDPLSIEVTGQVGSTASDDPTAPPVRPLDATTGVANAAMAAGQITMNLSAIDHPAELPPITMMNWLILLEEKRSEFVGN